MGIIQDLVVRYGYLMIAVGTVVEGDGTLLTGAFLSRRGYLRTPIVIVTAMLASALANQGYFWAARRRRAMPGERKWLHRLTARAGRRFQRHRVWLLLVSRFVYGFRIAIPAACGASDIRPLVFTVIDLVGAAAWALTFGLAGYSVGHVLERLWADLRQHEWQIALGLFLLALLVLERGRDWDAAVLTIHSRA